MKLLKGQQAPHFVTKDIHGREISLSSINKPTLLALFRYASCPMCNLRVHQLVSAYDEFKTAGIDIVAVFESPVDSVLQSLGQRSIPFTIIADPDQIIYSKYGSEKSLSKFAWSFIAQWKQFIKAMAKGFLPGKIDATLTRLPADLLIDGDGTILTAHYGADIGDHLSIKDILSSVIEPVIDPCTTY
ncbi:MAG: AhpC/TSA family protein [Fibrobacterales bacterium]